MDKNLYEQLKTYCMNHQIEKFETLFESLGDKEKKAYLSQKISGEKIDSDFYQLTFLGIAVTVNNAQMVDYLISQGAPLDTEVDYGKTPLFFAIEMRDWAIARSLLRAGANVNCSKKTSQGETVCSILHQCLMGLSDSQSEEADIARDLIKRGANIYTMNEVANTSPMTEAIMMDNWCVVDLLLEAGYDVNHPLNNHNTTLTQALIQEQRYFPYFKKVVELGGDLSQKDKFGHDTFFYINRTWTAGNIFSTYLHEREIEKEKSLISLSLSQASLESIDGPTFKV